MGCLYCLQQIETFSCIDTCLANSHISPVYTNIAIAGTVLSFAFVILAFVFKNNPKRSLGFKLLGITSLTIGIITLGFVFSGHWFLRNIPFIIPAIGIGSYATSYFLSFYLVRFSYKPKLMKNTSISRYINKTSKELKIKKPDFYIFNSVEPQAFLVGGYKKAVFLSKVLIKRLDLKSLKAVILHELYHLKRNSPILKNVVSSFGNLSFRILPVPIKELEKIEEDEIDRILLDTHKIDMNRIRKRLQKMNKW